MGQEEVSQSKVINNIIVLILIKIMIHYHYNYFKF